MAASDIQISEQPSAGRSLPAEMLMERIAEEIARAERQLSALSCLLVAVEDLARIERLHGEDFCERLLAYVGLTLRGEFRRYDRVGPTSEHEYLVVLPGADGARGEIVARRALSRLRSIKIEGEDGRSALGVLVGIATWREGLNAAELMGAVRTAAGRRNPEPSSLPSSLPVGPIGSPDALRI